MRFRIPRLKIGYTLGAILFGIFLIEILSNISKVFHTTKGTPRKNIIKNRKPKLNNSDSKDSCVLPYFEESSVPEHSKFKLVCNKEINEVKVKNGHLFIRDPKSVTCFHNNIVRIDDYNTNISSKTQFFNHGDPVPSDYFQITCLTKNLKQSFRLPLAAVVSKPKRSSQPVKTKQSKAAFGVNVAFLGFDSTSRLAFIHNLPKSYKYFTKQLNGVVLEKHNIIGDGTTVNLLGILTGLKERELPEARKNKNNSKPVDHFPWIFKNFKKSGYVTLHAEDNQAYGTFQYRLKGFTNPPVDHYYRPYFLQFPYKKGCLGSTPRHKVMFNIMREYYTTYKTPGRPKFSFVFHSESSHNNNTFLQSVDNDLVDMLKEFKPSGLFKNTILFLIGDHGARYSSQRKNLQGKYEERLPFLGVYLPPSLTKKKLYLMENLRKNAKHLTSHLDIHATLLHILGEKRLKKKVRSLSLFDEIRPTRTCKDLDIDVHWCACTRWRKLPTSSRLGKAATQSAVDFLNSLVKPIAHMCAKLKVRHITSVEHYRTNKAILAFKQSSDHDGYQPDFSDKMEANKETFRVTFSVSPSDGVFEITANYNFKTKQFTVVESQISRINRYAPWVKCLADKYPRLQKVCICLDAI